MDFNKFPKIHHIGSKYIKDIFASDVEITEKVDGSQFAFGILEGQLRIRSKNREIYLEDPDKLFKNGIDYVKSIQHRLMPNTVYYGEYLQKPRHNLLCYDRRPNGYVAIFGVFYEDTDSWETNHNILKEISSDLGMETVPLIYKGPVYSVDKLKELLQRKSFLGGVDIEGFVVKNYDKRYLLGDQVMTMLAGKYVSEAFKEVSDRKWKQEKTGKGKYESMLESYKTPARWMKAVQHLRDSGALLGEPKDIGSLIKIVKEDITEEEKENIKDKLWGIFGQEVLRKSVHGLPEWYKEQLMNGSFSE